MLNLRVLIYYTHTVKSFRHLQIMVPNLTTHVGVCVANYNFICETTGHCIIEFIEKARLRFLVPYTQIHFHTQPFKVELQLKETESGKGKEKNLSKSSHFGTSRNSVFRPCSYIVCH